MKIEPERVSETGQPKKPQSGLLFKCSDMYKEQQKSKFVLLALVGVAFVCQNVEWHKTITALFVPYFHLVFLDLAT
jgi:hypothetical protein